MKIRLEFSMPSLLWWDFEKKERERERGRERERER